MNRKSAPYYVALVASSTSSVEAQLTSYAYDALGRLTGITETGTATAATSGYDYDAAGNRRTATVGPSSTMAAQAAPNLSRTVAGSSAQAERSRRH